MYSARLRRLGPRRLVHDARRRDMAAGPLRGTVVTDMQVLPGGETTGPRTYTGTSLTRAGDVRFEYDALGRVVLRQKTRLSRKPDTWRYGWDGENRLTSVTTPDGPAGVMTVRGKAPDGTIDGRSAKLSKQRVAQWFLPRAERGDLDDGRFDAVLGCRRRLTAAEYRLERGSDRSSSPKPIGIRHSAGNSLLPRESGK